MSRISARIPSRVSGTFAAAMLLTVMCPGTEASAGVSCTAKHSIDNHPIVGADGATTTSNTGVDGVRGTLQVPNWTTTNLRGQDETVADVIFNIEDSVGHFFQVGWYISRAGVGNLPAASRPTPFFGEGTVSGSGGIEESLTLLLVPLAPGYHTFELRRESSADPFWNNRYTAKIDNSVVLTSRMTSTIEGTPSVVGETNWDCADMYEWSASPTGGPSLYGHHRTRGWSLWQQHLDVRYNSAITNPSCWGVGRIQNQTPTSYAWDLC